MNQALAPKTGASVPRKKSKLKWIILAGALLLIGGVAGAKYVKNGKDKGIPVTIEKAVIKTITQLVNATGKIQPELEVKISPEVSGEIIDLPLREGAEVKKGDLLVKIKPDNYRYQVERRAVFQQPHPGIRTDLGTHDLRSGAG